MNGRGETRVEHLRVGGPSGPWQRLGLVVVDGLIPLFGTGIRIVEDDPPGLNGWAIFRSAWSDQPDPVDRNMQNGRFHVDGLPTELIAAGDPIFVTHPLGAAELDHVVVATDSLERTCAAITEATGASLKRVREVGALRQGFHRMGGLIVEVVERTGLPVGPASFWGLVLTVNDLDAAVAGLGPDLVGAAKPAVQPGRSIATIRKAAGLGLPVALLSRP